MRAWWDRAGIRLRLLLLLLLFTPLLWAGTLLVAWLQARHEVDELFDTQQLLFARQLLASGVASARQERDLPRAKTLLKQQAPKNRRGDFDDDALSFAIWDAGGGLRLSSDGKQALPPPSGDASGFVALQHDDEEWRVLYLRAPDDSAIVAVGQELEFRRELAFKVAVSQLLPWLLALPLQLLLLVWAVGRGLAPLRGLAHELARRAPDERRAIAAPAPSEVRPLVDALDALFTRVADTLERERRFTADAAHELRTPLAALRVQAEVAQLAGGDAVRDKALNQLTLGIDRATRLVEQLLALSRLDPLAEPPSQRPVNWPALAFSVGESLHLTSLERGVTLQMEADAAPLPLDGDATLVELMLRNLLDNALRYTPPGGSVRLHLGADAIVVDDDGPGIDPAYLERVGERFFRPPGQDAPGSGLGLSIVRRIAALHGLRLELSNRPEGGLRARLLPG